MSAGRPTASAPKRRGSARAADADLPASVFARLAERLRRARQSRHWAAYEALWVERHPALFTAAYHYCVRIGCDAATAGQRATDALGDAWAEIGATLAPSEDPEDPDDSNVQKDPMTPCPGEPEFLKRLNARVIYRCKDRRREAALWDARHPDVERAGDDERDDLWEKLVGVPATQEEDLLGGARTRAAISDLVIRLATLRELCRNRPALIVTVDAMLAYVHHCFGRAVPPGIDTTSMSLDDLVKHAEPAGVDATKTAMFQYLMERLRVKRNGIDTRMADIREHLENMKHGQTFDG